MTKKTIIYAILGFGVGLAIASYAGEEIKTEASSSENVPETCILSRLAKIYQPVTFSHQMHSLIAEDCAVCHHHSGAGQTPSCDKCHPVSLSSKESGGPELKDAYHRQCTGCHKEVEMGPTGCMECHTKRSWETPPAKTASKKDVPVKKISEDITVTYTLSSLEKMYEPVIFSHGMHAEMAEGCATCHHHTEAGQTPSCRECHRAAFDPKNLNMPGIKGAYHLQCMGCHQEMGGPVGCTQCHAKKATQTTERGQR